MKKRVEIILFTCSIFLFAFFCHEHGKAAQKPLFKNFIEKDIDTRLSRMSLEKKIGQILIFGFYGTALDEDYRIWLSSGKLGNIKIFLRNIQSKEQLKKLTNFIAVLADNSGQGIPPFIATDVEGGVVNHLRSPGISRAPAAGLIGATTYAENNRNISRLIALTLFDLGINMNFAPCADVLTNPKNFVIGTRSYSSDPNLVSAMVKSFIEEQKKLGILATPKHFPGHGMTDFDSHQISNAVSTTRRELDQIHLLPYKKLIKERKLDGCMVSHIIYSEFDPLYPAAFSPVIVNNLLRKELDFKGIVVTDDLEMKGSQNYAKSIEEAFILAFNAGNDLLLIAHTKSKQVKILNNITELFKNRILSEEELNVKVLRILKIKKQYLTHFYTMKDTEKENKQALINALKETKKAIMEGPVQLSSNIKGSIPEYFNKALKNNLKGVILAPTRKFSSLAKDYFNNWDVIYIEFFPDRKKNRRRVNEVRNQLKSYDIAILGLANERQAEWAKACIEEKVQFGILSINNPFSAHIFAQNALFIVTSFDPYSPGLDALFTCVFKTGDFSGTFPYYF